MAATKDRPTAASSRIPATPLNADQAMGNLAARKALLDEFGAFSSRELIASGMRSAVGVFSVPYGERELYPRFQFGSDGQPLPAMAEVLALLEAVRTPWEIALWFSSANGWLGGDRPVDLLQTAPERVVEAAKHEAEQRVF